jgi:hypothetical protein
MTFRQFYAQAYLPRHPAGACRLLHLLGVPAAAALAALVVWLRVWWLVVLVPMPAYVLGWLGHLLVRNVPTFFEHPVWSFVGYWKMIASIVLGNVGLRDQAGVPKKL